MKPRAALHVLPALALSSLLVSLPCRGQDNIDLEKQAEPLTQVQVKYPEDALKNRIEGTVYVGIYVNEKGRVTEAKVEKSDAEVLNKAALDAAGQWTFTPAIAKKDKKPVGVWLTIPFKFKLQEDGKEKKTGK